MMFPLGFIMRLHELQTFIAHTNEVLLFYFTQGLPAR